MRNLLIPIFAAILMFCSCKKETSDYITPSNNQDQITTDQENGNSASILKFNSNEEYNKMIGKVKAMSLEELREYEEANGYVSFGRKSEELYSSINFEDFQSIEDIKLFITNKSDYLELIDDGYGELELESLFSSSLDRYIMNINRMYQIGNQVYKIFKKGTLSSHVKNIDLLLTINQKNLKTVKNNKNFKFTPSSVISMENRAPNSCGAFEKRSTNGNDRTKVEVYTTNDNTILARVRAYKRSWKHGIWFHVRRRISCDIQVAVKAPSEKRVYFSMLSDGSSPRFSVQEIYWLPSSFIGHEYIEAYDIWADTPSTGSVIGNCNSSILN